MNIYSWNVNGIRAAQKKGFISWLLKEDIDILAIQETKAQPSQLDSELLKVPGYHCYFQSATKKGYSGTAIYTKEEPLSVRPLGIAAFDEEGRVCIAEYERFTLINCYFPNSQNEGKRLEYKRAFCNAIFHACNTVVSARKNVILCGDYNIAHKAIDLARPKQNEGNPGYLPEERAWMNEFIAAGYVDTFRELHPDNVQYSWWSYRFGAREKNIGWRIDYHCVNQSLLESIISAEIHANVMGSDHCPVSIALRDTP